MRILIVCSGNVENFSLEKHHAFIFDQVNSVKKLYPDTYFDYFFIKGRGFFGYLSNLKSFRMKIKCERYDLVHAHYSLSSLLANMQLSVPVVTTFHGSDINLRHLNILSSLSSVLSRHSIFVSNKLRDKILFKANKNKINVIPCGIDLSEFYPVDRNMARDYFKLSSDKKYILFSSSFSNMVKNFPLAEKAVKLLNDNSVELLELKNYNRSEVNLLLNAVDAALMTSFSEGSPQFIKEAMAVNCPVVSTAIGDVIDIISGIEGCYITDYSPEDVAENLVKALKTERTKGRERIIHFDNINTAEKVYHVYLKATRSKVKL